MIFIFGVFKGFKDYLLCFYSWEVFFVVYLIWLVPDNIFLKPKPCISMCGFFVLMNSYISNRICS